MVSAQIGPEAGPAGLGAEEGLLSPCCVGRPLPALGYKSRDPRETGRAGAGPWEELGAPLGGRPRSGANVSLFSHWTRTCLAKSSDLGFGK